MSIGAYKDLLVRFGCEGQFCKLLSGLRQGWNKGVNRYWPFMNSFVLCREVGKYICVLYWCCVCCTLYFLTSLFLFVFKVFNPLTIEGSKPSFQSQGFFFLQ